MQARNSWYAMRKLSLGVPSYVVTHLNQILYQISSPDGIYLQSRVASQGWSAKGDNPNMATLCHTTAAAIFQAPPRYIDLSFGVVGSRSSRLDMADHALLDARYSRRQKLFHLVGRHRMLGLEGRQ